MKKIALVILFLFTFQTLGFSSIVDTEYKIFDGEYKILRGEIVRLTAKGITRVLLYEQDVVAIVKAESAFVEVIGQRAGETIVELFTEADNALYRITVEEKDVSELYERIVNVLHDQMGYKEIKISKNPLTNKVILEGEMREEDLGKVKVILAGFSSYIEDFLKLKESRDIIEIDIEIIEMSSEAARTMGVNLPTALAFGETESGIFDGSGQVDITRAGRKAATIKPFFKFLESASRTAFAAAVSFLIQDGKARILSKPRLACLSGKTASLSVGGERPIMTTSIASGGAITEVSYKSYGIDLSIAPIVKDNDQIEIQLDVSVSEVQESEVLGTIADPSARAYPMTRRSTSTTLLMNDGQTLTISGLIKKKEEESESRFPFLGSIPILGNLFKHKTTSKGGGSGALEDMELVIMLTPRIIRTGIDSPEDFESLSAVAAPSAVSQDSQANEVLQYSAQVRDKIIRSLRYPLEAQEAGWQAEVKVSLHLSADGVLLTADILESSGYKVFDDAVLETINEIPYYPPFPTTVEDRELWIEIPVVYRIN